MSACWSALAIRPCCAWKGSAANIPKSEFYAKAEWFNPGGSVKDRAALNMIREGERSGALRPGKTILDATSGNTGIAYAMIGAALGISRDALPSLQRQPRKKANSVGLRRRDHPDVRRRRLRRCDSPRARDSCRERRTNIFIPISTAIRPTGSAHYQDYRARRFGSRPRHAVTHFVAGLGTSGTFVGTARRLKELNPRIQCISLQPDAAFHGLEGWKHMASALVPAIYDPRVADRESRDRDRRRLRDGQAPGARGGHAGEPQRRRGFGRLHASCGSAAEGRARRDRDHLSRCRGEISQRAILGRRRSLLGRWFAGRAGWMR